MEIVDLLINRERQTLTFCVNELDANFEIRTPTPNDYCIGWKYNSKGPIHEAASYDFDHVNRLTEDGDLEPVFPAELERELNKFGFEIDVLDTLLSMELEKYHVTKTSPTDCIQRS